MFQKIIITSCLIAFSSVLSIQSKPTNQRQTNDDCGDVIPGFELFESGYTLTDLDLLSPMDLGWKKAILTRSCNTNQTMYNEYLSKEFQQPDQVDSIIQVGGSGTSQTSILVTDSKQLSIDLLLTISKSFLFGIFSSTKTFFAKFMALTQEAVYVGRRYVYESAYKISLHDSLRTDIMNLSDDAQFLIDNLASTFNETTAQSYYYVIDNYGSHYLDEAIIGCKMEYQHETGMGKLDVMASTDIDINAGFNFLDLLKESGAVTGTVTAASDTYMNVTRSTMNCYGGGQACPSDPASYQEWLNTCPTVPTFITGTFQPVTNLIRDPVKSVEFEKATWSHMNRAFLEMLGHACQVMLDIAKTPLAFYDSGGNCSGAPKACPNLPACNICDGSDEFPEECKIYNSPSPCPNPEFNADQVEENAQIVQKNITAWSKGISSLMDQAQVALKFNVVPNITVLALGVEFYEYVKNIQSPIQELECGWTFSQYRTSYPFGIAPNDCVPGDGNNYVQRTIRYIKGLYWPFPSS